MNIAICDDEDIIREKLSEQVGRVIAQTTYSCSQELFSSGDELLEFIDENPGYFQIYLLDIGMSGTDGLETAKRIRRRDKDAVLLFITSYRELMPEAFQVLAFGFLVKPVKKEELVRMLMAAFHLLECRNTLYFYKSYKNIHTLSLVQIQYIESRGRKVILHLVNGENREYYGTLKEAATKTQGLTFVQAHHSFLVNLEQIKALESWEITMQGGDKIKISNTYHSSFHKNYRNFILIHSRGENHG